MTRERLLILGALSALTVSASAQRAPEGDVIIQAPHRYTTTGAAFSADDAYVMVYDETSGGSLIEMATGRVVALQSSLDFSEVVQRLSQGSIDPPSQTLRPTTTTTVAWLQSPGAGSARVVRWRSFAPPISTTTIPTRRSRRH